MAKIRSLCLVMWIPTSCSTKSQMLPNSFEVSSYTHFYFLCFLLESIQILILPIIKILVHFANCKYSYLTIWYIFVNLCFIEPANVDCGLGFMYFVFPLFIFSLLNSKLNLRHFFIERKLPERIYPWLLNSICN